MDFGVSDYNTKKGKTLFSETDLFLGLDFGYTYHYGLIKPFTSISVNSSILNEDRIFSLKLNFGFLF